MTAVTKARYAVRLETEHRIPAVSNYAQNLRARFESDGIEVELRENQRADSRPLGIHLSRWGRDGAPRTAGRGARHPSDDRVEYRYEGITEWWLNAPRGLEQGFTIDTAPAGDREQPLVVDLDVTGGWHAAAAGNAIGLTGPGGEHLRYSDLLVTDANGTTLPARMSGVDDAIEIRVEDRGAVYPITIDPLLTTQEAQLIGNSYGGEAEEFFGFSVALSGDTALVGAWGDDTVGGNDGGNAGALYVFVRSDASWSQQARLVPTDAAGGKNFGFSVALSGDTALIGAPGDNSGAGSAYTFVRNGTSWSQQARFVASDGAPGDAFGRSVALSEETALVGAYLDETAAGSQAGSAYVFVRSGANWSQQIQLLASDGASLDRFGGSVALSGDTAVIGAADDDNTGGISAGSAYVFVRTGANWFQQAQLLAGDAAQGDHFGWSVALDGDTALVGAPIDDTSGGSQTGSAYVFVRSGTMWTEQDHLVADDATPGDRFGESVALGGDTALVGARLNDTATGADAGSAYVFVRSGTLWSQQAQLLIGNGGPSDWFGHAVALSGNTALVGAYLDDRAAPDAGAAFVFVRGGTTWTQQAQFAANGGAPFDRFGVSVALSGNTAVVGAPFDDVAGGTDAGTAFVFVRTGTTWNQQTQLLGTFGDLFHEFGTSVDIDGDTVVIGSPKADIQGGVRAGVAEVFVRSGTTWSSQVRLFDVGGGTDDRFGASVALSGDTVVVGAPLDNTAAGTDAGSAYVFVRSATTWSQQAQLFADNASAGDNFGYSAALDGDTALIGAWHSNAGGRADAGSAYVFIRNGPGWTQQGELLASNGAQSDEFGSSVALSGDTALIGAPLDDTAAGTDAGSAYAFVRSGVSWTEQAHFWATDLAPNDQFGRSVALSGDTAIVGAPLDDTAVGIDAGSAHVFLRSGASWIAEAELLASDRQARDNFGSSVALGGDTALIGASADDTVGGSDTGSVYVFRIGILTDLDATPTSATTILLEWNSVSGANHYEVQRNSGAGFSTIASPVTDSYFDSVSANTAHVYRVRAIGSNGQTSGYTNIDLATTSVFTDDPLVAGTIIKAVHLIEIRTAVNAVRAAAGLAGATFTDPDPTGLAIKAVHITESRSALDAARSALGLPTLTYTNAPLQGMPVRALDFSELRNGVK